MFRAVALGIAAIGWLVGAASAWWRFGPLVAVLLFVWVVPLGIVLVLFAGAARRPLARAGARRSTMASTPDELDLTGGDLRTEARALVEP